MEFFSFLFYILLLLFTIYIFIIVFADCDLLTWYYSHWTDTKTLIKEFDDKVVWITGASSGIGEALAKQLIKCGPCTSIVLSARRTEELERLKKELLKISIFSDQSHILVLPMDMLDYESHKTAHTKIIETFGKVDVLISNAGRSQRAPWAQTEMEVDKELFELNVFSLLNLNRIVLRHYLEEKEAGKAKSAKNLKLVVMSSIAGKMGVYHSGSYAGSKHALHGYFDSLRNEMGNKGIDITLICPGPVMSPILQQAFTSKKGKVVGLDYPKDDRRMTAERCAFLTLVAVANKLEESWLALSPIVAVTYISAYCPPLYTMISKFVYSRGLHLKVRGTKERSLYE